MKGEVEKVVKWKKMWQSIKWCKWENRINDEKGI